MNLSTRKGRHARTWVAVFVAVFALASMALAQSVSTTTVQGTVYFANGQPGAGTVQIQWPSFTTAAGQAIAAGATSVTVGSDGFLTVNLAPNQGASPAGLFYTVTYYLSNGATNTEYWVVPDTAQATLAQVRASVMPSSQAIQTVSKSYVDQAIANISQSGLSPTGGTLSGPLYLAGDPSASLQAADKHYVDAAIAQTVPLSGATLTGPLNGPAFNASVNNVINVMAPPYNAKGDCVTDDQASIQAAFNAAQANTSSNTVVYFPPPPGGCYLTSQLNWYGVSLRGEAGNNLNGKTWQGVTLKGKPGQDILHTGDPDSTTSVPTRLWSIENLRFVLDDSIDASGPSGNFAHRWPGRWVGDGAMTAGGVTLSSTYAEFTCADIGNAIVVKGAGAGGADLVTTITAVSPCYGNNPTSITLAAAASTTVSAANVYIAFAGMTASQQVGNCAIAMDNKDGDSSNWLTGGTRVPIYDNLHNINFATINGGSFGQKASCAIWWQGQYIPYGLDARNINITNFVYGVLWGTYDVNPEGSASNNSSLGQDYQLWDHGKWSSYYPWISFNGGDNTIKDIQLYDMVGPQMVGIETPVESGGPYRWQINMPEHEQGSGAPYGFRIEGFFNQLNNTALASDGANITAFVGGASNYCRLCGEPQTLDLGGRNNIIHTNGIGNTVNDYGYGNFVTASDVGTQNAGQTPTQEVVQTVTKGYEPWGRLSADFIRSGNVNTPYMNLGDLLILPADVRWNSGLATTVVPDATSLTGKHAYTNGVYSIFGFGNPVADPLTGRTYNYVIGSTAAGAATVPAAKVILYASVKCPAVASYSLSVRANGATIASATPTCNSSGYTVGSVTADLSSYAGQNFGFAIGSGSGEVDWAYVAIRPYQADYNGYQPLNKAGDSMTGPLILNADPSAALGAATKAYVDAHASTVTVSAFSPVGGFSGAAGTGFTANTLNYYMFNLPYNMTVTHLEYRLTTADNTANNYDIGLYSVSGTTATLIADFGATAGTTFSPGTGVKTIALTQGSVSLTPGQYILASTTNCASSCAILAQGATGTFTYSYNAASGSSTGGQLPSSFTINPATTQNSAWGFGIY